MENIEKCPICLNAHGAAVRQIWDRDGVYCLECTVCGRYELSREGYDDELQSDGRHSGDWTEIKRAALSHALLTQREVPLSDNGHPILKRAVLNAFRTSEKTLPTKLQQANNIIQFIGNYERDNGRPIQIPEGNFYAIVGAVNPISACKLVIELYKKELLQVTDVSHLNECAFRNASLSLDGWERWEKERSRENTSNVGMIAMQFGDPILDALVDEVIKPAVKNIPGLSVERIDDKPTAGIIDVILRQTIRDAAFVIADLSHANRGAYWEAGFAEGLGKPVIYICEQSVWDDQKTHFDTNHCTTIIYEKGEEVKFRMQLIATLKNSLNLFS